MPYDVRAAAQVRRQPARHAKFLLEKLEEKEEPNLSLMAYLTVHHATRLTWKVHFKVAYSLRGSVVLMKLEEVQAECIVICVRWRD